jgi:cephalosporin hydroxylase
MQDDREQFAAEQRERAAAIAADAGVQAAALEATVLSDRRDWSYVWRWLGLPVIQMPTDVVAFQEVVWERRPQLIIETGVARGGSIILSASLLQLLGEGHVLGIDIDIRQHNRDSIEQHPLAHPVGLVEGSSTSPEVVELVRAAASEVERVMVVLDSNHTHEHVLEELRLYAPLVTAGQFLVVADTIIESLPRQEHRVRPWGPGDNPATALDQYLRETPGTFEVDEYVNGKLLMTSSPGGYLRRRA